MHLDLGFEELVRNKLGTYGPSLLTPERHREILKYFETQIKEEFNPTDPECEAEYPTPFHGVPDLPEIGIQSGYLKLRKWTLAATLY